MLGPLLALATLLQAPTETAAGSPAEAAEPVYDHVVLLSVDGLRSDALLPDRLERLPGFSRLLGGAFTLDARTDPDDTRTLPNHVGMLTGRTKLGPDGHRWESNSSPPPGLEIHDLRGARTAGIFEVLTAHGLRGAVFSAKEKFYLFPRSWQGSDAGRGADGGVVDVYHHSADPGLQLEALTTFVTARAFSGQRSFSLLHIAGLDVAGHAYGWDSDPDSAYGHALITADRFVEVLLRELAEIDGLDERGQALSGRFGPIAVILTTDHGGGVPLKNHHSYGRAHVNVAIPFAVWTSDGRAAGDLYALNPDLLAAPGLRDPRHDDPAPPPLRNLDAGNLALDLLGLPAIPGSTVGAHQALRIAPPRVGDSEQ